MLIKGLRCSYCSGELEGIRIVDGVLHTKCINCNTVSEPPPVKVKHEPIKTQRDKYGHKSSGTYPKVEVLYRPNRQATEKKWAKSGGM